MNRTVMLITKEPLIFLGSIKKKNTGLSSSAVPGLPWHPQILADQLTASQPEGADYAHHIILAPPDGFSDHPTALNNNEIEVLESNSKSQTRSRKPLNKTKER